MALKCHVCLTEFPNQFELMAHEGKNNGLWCCVCLNSFSRIYDKTYHFGCQNHNNRLQAVVKAKPIWDTFHANQGQMAFGPRKEEPFDEAQKRRPNISEIKPPGEKRSGRKGTLADGAGVVSIHLGGLKNHKVFEEVAYQINADANRLTQKFAYVEWCVAHGLFKYCGKYFGQSDASDLGRYFRTQLFSIKLIRRFMRLKFRDGWSEEDISSFILFFRRGSNLTHDNLYKYLYEKKATKEEMVQFKKDFPNLSHVKASDANLYFCRHDCHPLFLRVDVVATYKTKKEVDNCEKHLISASDSFKYWTGGHNNVDEINRMQNRDYRPPTAFYMMAPMDNLANLTKWMEDNGIEKERNYPSDYLFSKKLSPPVSPTPSSTISEDEITEEKIQFVMSGYPDSTRQHAIATIDGLRLIDEKYSVKKLKLQ